MAKAKKIPIVPLAQCERTKPSSTQKHLKIIDNIKKINSTKNPCSSASKNANSEKQHDPNEDVTIQATPDIIQLIDDLKRLEDLKKKLCDIEDSYKSQVMNFMALNQTLKIGPITLATWKNHTRKSFDTNSFKSAFPDTYDTFIKESSVRVFRLF